MYRTLMVAIAAIALSAPASAGFDILSPEAKANSHSSSRAGAAAGAVSGSKSGVYGSGNSYNHNSNKNRNSNHTSVGVETDVDASSRNHNRNSAKQGQGQAQGQETTVEGDSTYVEGDDFRFPAAQAPMSFSGECNQGIGAQGVGGGGSIATGNPVCDWRIVHSMAIASGDKLNADWAVYQARKAAERRSLMSTVRSFLTLGLL